MIAFKKFWTFSDNKGTSNKLSLLLFCEKQKGEVWGFAPHPHLYKKRF